MILLETEVVDAVAIGYPGHQPLQCVGVSGEFAVLHLALIHISRVSLAQSGPSQSAVRPPATLAITSRSSLPSARMRTSRLRAS